MSDINANSSTPVSSGSSSEQETTAKFQRSELVRGWREYESRMPRVVPLLKFAGKTDMGQVRENNEDKFDFYEPEVPAILAARGSLFAVGDGIGGALAGQIASEMMLKNLITVYYNHPASDVETALREAIVDSNDKVYRLAQMIPERAGMGTTLTAAVFVEDRIVIAQVGDSRAYLLRDNMARQVTRDHSWVEEQVRAGVLSRYEAESSPFRNLITRSIGAAPTIEPDFYQEQARVGDIWVLCSDGLTGHVHDEEIARIASRHSPSEAARQLIELANTNGGRDNITVIVLSIRDLISHPTPVSSQKAASEGGATVINTVPPPLSGNALRMEPGTPQFAAASAGDYIASNPQLSVGGARPRAGWRRLFGR